MSNSPQISRHDELLIDSVLFGLDGIEAEEFTKLKDQNHQENESGQRKVSHEMAAAALDLSFLKIEAMPSRLAEKIVNQGRAFCANLAGDRTSRTDGANRSSESLPAATMGGRDSKASHAHSDSKSEKPTPATGSRWATADDLENTISDSSVSPREILSWATAAAIAFVAYFLWSTGNAENQVAERKLGDLQSENQLLLRDLTSAQQKANELKEAQADANDKLIAFKTKAEFANLELQKLRDKLYPDGEKIYQQVAKSEDAIKWTWEDVKGEGISGDLVWDTKDQLGSMKISGLPKNDPSEKQYQLWIIEENGREKPVDGGVFDITSDGEVYVVMRPKLVASKPKEFAITLEKAGGVVESNLNELPLLAKAPDAK